MGITPTFWWPSDESWFVHTPLDGYSSYVGGDSETMHRVWRATNLETLFIEPDTSIDTSPFTV
jgi:hypothetical protein